MATLVHDPNPASMMLGGKSLAIKDPTIEISTNICGALSGSVECYTSKHMVVPHYSSSADFMCWIALIFFL